MCTQETINGINSGKLIAVPKWTGIFNIVSPIAIILLIFGFGIEKATMDDAIKLNTEHRMNKILHMSYLRKTELFVPRTEVQYKLDAIDDNFNKLDSKMNAIMDKLNINYKLNNNE